MLQVSNSTSTKIGLAPNNLITSAVEIQVNGVVITSSPFEIPRAINAINNASVPEETVMQYFDLLIFFNSCSNFITSSPIM